MAATIAIVLVRQHGFEPFTYPRQTKEREERSGPRRHGCNSMTLSNREPTLMTAGLALKVSSSLGNHP